MEENAKVPMDVATPPDCYFHDSLPRSNREYVVVDQSIVQTDSTLKQGVKVGLIRDGPFLTIRGIGNEKKWAESIERQISLGGQCLAGEKRIQW